MKTSRIIILFIFIALTIFLLRKEESFQNNFAMLTLPIKENYLELSNSVGDTIDKYLNQAESVSVLKEENLLLRKYLYQQKINLTQLKQLNKYSETKFNNFDNILRVQTISYKKLNDFSQVYLTKGEELGEDKIYGLIQKNVVAGIALKADGPLKGILLSNPICQFSTFIGDKKTPGIAKGIDAESIEVNFIPKWSNIKVGDKVMTSGLDNIFLPDIPVGVVTNILTKSTYKTAIVKTYADVLHPSFFYLVKEVLHEPEDINTSKMKLEDNSTKEIS
ncbi:MAG: Rod shape-determining protein MreC [uncultured Sulfurovum sp.]|uniref:Cell shape-determining protein MreC n=1 Tax=uncultured Sulfurovum sp. TaxID=269237 RepID=A0A6S6TH52_9BACT|nr:MAG: Rod shape-determining protein MreC [uncultured Sulfurovum sp.]